MVKTRVMPRSGNRVLDLLPELEHRRLIPQLSLVSMKLMQILNESQAPIAHVFFPIDGVVSAIALMENGDSVEVATIGNEGMVGLDALVGQAESPNRMMVQVDGQALRMEIAQFRTETADSSPLRLLLARYHTAFSYQVSYGVACNALHQVLQRCCRWILMTHDRVPGDDFFLTHEFLAQMLGVRRSSVTVAVNSLQKKGLIQSHRGRITVLNRTGLEDKACECYRRIQEVFKRLFNLSMKPPLGPVPGSIA